eukprot:scaffold521_cov167-Amphora_coffeaeformis.AAC.34
MLCNEAVWCTPIEQRSASWTDWKMPIRILPVSSSLSSSLTQKMSIQRAKPSSCVGQQHGQPRNDTKFDTLVTR